MERNEKHSTGVCEQCGHSLLERPETPAPEDAESAAVLRPPLTEIRTPGGRVVYVVNLN